MKKYVLAILIAVSAMGCTTIKKSDRSIFVSIVPQKFFVEKIAGDLVHVNVLVPPGASPETYSLMPSQMRNLSKATAWLKIGQIGFEQTWTTKIEQSNPNLKIIDTSKGVHWIGGTAEAPTGVDPHIWMSPKEAMGVVNQTYKALIDLFPEHKAIFTKNYDVFIQEIKQLDTEIGQRLSQVKQKKFLIFHPALTYFARDYGLKQIPLEIEGKEPSASYMKKIVEEAKNDGIHIIFIQKEFDVDHAKEIAGEINGKVESIDPLNENWIAEIKLITDKLTATDGETHRD